MKPSVFVMGLITLCASALAQNGTIDINNNSLFIYTNSIALGGSSGRTVTGPPSFYFEVLTAPSTVTTVDASLQDLLTSTWSDTGVSGTNTPSLLPSALGREIGGPGFATNWAPG